MNDYDLAANNGGWQWSASTGNDAQPWFRIFNPVLQSKRFDADGRFIRRYVPELAACDSEVHPRTLEGEAARPAAAGGYPPPIVDHLEARQATLRMFEAATRDKRQLPDGDRS